MFSEKWTLVPQGAPVVVRACAKCGAGSRFVCSDNFRVNANGKKLDVWLIYRCQRCETTWNLTIHERVNPQSLNAALYQAYLANDRDTARRCASDVRLLASAKAVASYDGVGYDLRREVVPGAPGAVEIIAPPETGLRLDRLVAEALGLSRRGAQAWLQARRVTDNGRPGSEKTKVKGNIQIEEKLSI